MSKRKFENGDNVELVQEKCAKYKWDAHAYEIGTVTGYSTRYYDTGYIVKFKSGECSGLKPSERRKTHVADTTTQGVRITEIDKKILRLEEEIKELRFEREIVAKYPDVLVTEPFREAYVALRPHIEDDDLLIILAQKTCGQVPSTSIHSDSWNETY